MNYLNYFYAFTEKLCLSFALMLASALFIYAAPGDLDRSFGNNGIVKTPFNEANSIEASTIQPDGKIVVVGAIHQSASNRDFYVLRFNPNGSFDTSFGVNGKAIIVVSNRDDRASGVALQADGKIIVVGSSRDSSANYNFTIVRLNQNGTLDTTFNTTGFAITLMNAVGDFNADVVVQPDNKIVVSGRGPGSSDITFVAVRYNNDGSLDTSFDGDGVAKIQFGAGLNSSAFAVKLQPDGKIVLAGVASIVNFGAAGFGIARLNTDGTPDNSFGNNGTVTVAGSAQQSAAYELLIQPDGKIVAVGYSNSGLATFYDFAVVRLNSNGSLDDTFGSSGKVVTPIQGNNQDEAREVILQPDGKLLVGGIGKIANDTDLTLIRYNSNGTPDTRFGNNGVALTRITNTYEGISNLKIEPDGKIFAVGLATFSGISNYELTLARYQVNGSREADFDGDKKTDFSVFRPSDGSWYLSRSSNNAFISVQFGAAGDLIAPADFDGDGKTDISVFRPADGGWYRLNSSNDTFSALQFGTSGDLPVPGDFDGDAKADITVYRPSAGSWYRVNSSNNQFIAAQFGIAEDKPLVGDFDGDGKSDLTVFRPSNGTWYRINSATDSFSPNQFGAPGDLPVAADYDGDGKTDLAVYRPSVGDWYVINSINSSLIATHFGISEDKPAPADFDGDGKADLVVFRPSTGTWYLLRTTTGFTGVQFGANGDVPVPNAFVR